jgi:hypothetical protein
MPHESAMRAPQASADRAVSVGWSSPFELLQRLEQSGAAASGGGSASSGLFFLASALAFVAAWWVSRLLRPPPARRWRPAFSLLLEHPG